MVCGEILEGPFEEEVSPEDMYKKGKDDTLDYLLGLLDGITDNKNNVDNAAYEKFKVAVKGLKNKELF